MQYNIDYLSNYLMMFAIKNSFNVEFQLRIAVNIGWRCLHPVLSPKHLKIYLNYYDPQTLCHNKIDLTMD